MFSMDSIFNAGKKVADYGVSFLQSGVAGVGSQISNDVVVPGKSSSFQETKPSSFSWGSLFSAPAQTIGATINDTVAPNVVSAIKNVVPDTRTPKNGLWGSVTSGLSKLTGFGTNLVKSVGDIVAQNTVASAGQLVTSTFDKVFADQNTRPTTHIEEQFVPSNTQNPGILLPSIINGLESFFTKNNGDIGYTPTNTNPDDVPNNITIEGVTPAVSTSGGVGMSSSAILIIGAAIVLMFLLKKGE